jgi:hypothetical protein
MLTSAERSPKRKWLVIGGGLILVLGLLTAVAAIASAFLDEDAITGARCERIAKNTRAMVEAEAAKMVTDRAQIGYSEGCDSGSPGGVSGVTSDTPAQIRAASRALERCVFSTACRRHSPDVRICRGASAPVSQVARRSRSCG